MIKQMIQWEGFDGRQVSKTLYFNLTKYEVAGEMELEVLQRRFQDFLDNVINDTEVDPDKVRDMTPPEIRELLDMVKVMVKYAYGERSADGTEFRKSPEIWDSFVATGAFDAFIWHLFQDEGGANSFMTGIWPKEMQEEFKGKNALQAVPDAPDAPDAEEKPWYEYTKDEMDALDDADFNALLNRSKDGNNLPAQLLVIASQRKNRGQTE